MYSVLHAYRIYGYQVYNSSVAKVNVSRYVYKDSVILDDTRCQSVGEVGTPLMIFSDKSVYHTGANVLDPKSLYWNMK